MNNRRRLGTLSEHMETRLVLSPLFGLASRPSLDVDGSDTRGQPAVTPSDHSTETINRQVSFVEMAATKQLERTPIDVVESAPLVEAVLVFRREEPISAVIPEVPNSKEVDFTQPLTPTVERQPERTLQTPRSVTPSVPAETEAVRDTIVVTDPVDDTLVVQPARKITRPTDFDDTKRASTDVTARVAPKEIVLDETAVRDLKTETSSASRIDNSDASAADAISNRLRANDEETSSIVPVLSTDEARVVLSTRSNDRPVATIPLEISNVADHANVRSADVDVDDGPIATSPANAVLENEITKREAIETKEDAGPAVAKSTSHTNTFAEPEDSSDSSVRNRHLPKRHQRPLNAGDVAAPASGQHVQFQAKKSESSRYDRTAVSSPSMTPAFWMFADQGFVLENNADRDATYTVFGDATRLGIMLAAINQAGRRSGSLVNFSGTDENLTSDGGGVSQDRRRRKTTNGRKPSKVAERLRRAFHTLETIDEDRAIPCVSESPDLVFADAASMCVLFQETDSSTAGTSRSSLFGGLLLAATATGVAVNKASRRRKIPTFARPKPATPRYSGDTVVFAD